MRALLNRAPLWLRAWALLMGTVGAIVFAGVAVGSGANPTTDPAALAPPPTPPSYVGWRLDRSWTYDGNNWNPVDALKTLGSPTSFENTPLPDNVALDSGSIQTGTNADGTPIMTPVNPGAANSIAGQVAKSGSYINRSTFTVPITRAAADTPLQPVWCAKCASDMRKMLSGDSADFTTYLGGGVPIPADYQPADYPTDSDAEFVVVQPDYDHTCGTTHNVGRMYEVWRLRRNLDANGNQIVFDPSQPASATNAAWIGSAGGRVVNLATDPGHYRNVTSGCSPTQPGAPDSNYQIVSWQMLAAGTHLAEEMDSREDCQRYALDGTVPPHALGLQVTDAHTGKRWPAQSYDGGSSTLAVQEGMRLRLAPDAVEPAGQTRAFDMIWKQAQRYGFIVDDRTFGAVAPRFEAMPDHTAAPECSQLLDGVATSSILKQFPWSSLQVLAVGSDSTPNPLAP
jgi:hypothetical protein